MKKSVTQILLFMMTMVLFSCAKPVNKDSHVLFSEIDLSAAPNSLAVKEKDNGWQLLFDGKTFDGWHGYNLKNIPDCWAIEDACLTMKTIGGAESQDIITNKKYRSFAFSVEYKVAKVANSGIIFQVAEDTIYKFPYETGPEMQIIDDENWLDTLENWQLSGANYAMYPPLVKAYNPVGEWNHILLIVDGNKVTQMLNGQITAKYEKYSEEWKKLRNSGKWSKYLDWSKFDEGFISLQNHGSKVWFRSIKLKEL